MLETLRRYLDSLAGFTEFPRDRAEKLVAHLQERGEVRARDVQAAVRHLVERSARNRRDLLRLVRKEIRRQVQGLGLATHEEVERLAKRVRALERAPERKPARKPARARRAEATKS